VGTGVAHKLFSQPRLAHPGLAFDGDDAAARPIHRLPQPFGEHRVFPIPAREVRAAQRVGEPERTAGPGIAPQFVHAGDIPSLYLLLEADELWRRGDAQLFFQRSGKAPVLL
jgi:hypothetical protein